MHIQIDTEITTPHPPGHTHRHTYIHMLLITFFKILDPTGDLKI